MKASELIRNRIKKIQIKNWNWAWYMIEELEELLPQIEALEKDSVESLLDGIDGWACSLCLEIVRWDFVIRRTGFWDTPKKALIGLESKLIESKDKLNQK